MEPFHQSISNQFELSMNVIQWQKIYFFINLDICEVWMGKFLDILAAPLLQGMLNV